MHHDEDIDTEGNWKHVAWGIPGMSHDDPIPSTYLCADLSACFATKVPPKSYGGLPDPEDKVVLTQVVLTLLPEEEHMHHHGHQQNERRNSDVRKMITVAAGPGAIALQLWFILGSSVGSLWDYFR